MVKVLFISAVSCAGKTTICDYIKNNNLLEDYSIYDIDDLENINEYVSDSYHVFYENSIKKAILKSNGKNIIIGSCINPNDLEKIVIPKEIESIEMILITCSNEELKKRLKQRDVSRNCGNDEYINEQINYQNYLLKHLGLYNLHLDNSNCSIENISKQIVNYIKEKRIVDKETNYIIRKSEQKDCFAIARIVTIAWNETYKGLVPDWFLEKLKNNEKERAQNSFDNFDIKENKRIVLEVNNEVVGFVKYGITEDNEFENCGEIIALYILSKYKGNGYGRKLVEKAIDEIKKLGCDKMIIACLKGNPSNEFYKHIGGVYIKDGEFKKLNLPENIYYFDNI